MKYLLALGFLGLVSAQCSHHNGDKEECCNTEGCGYQANGQCEEGDPVFLESADNTCNGAGNSAPSCDKSVTAEFKGTDGNSNYTVSIDSGPESFDPPITMCHGDTLKVTGTVFGGHPLQIWHNGMSILENSGEATLFEGEYTYKCDYHPSMRGVITVLPPPDPYCACEVPSGPGELHDCSQHGSDTCPAEYGCDYQSGACRCFNPEVCTDGSGGHEPPSDPGHQCDAHTCPDGFTKRSNLPETLGSFPVKECCRPLKKGCKDGNTAFNYDPSVDIHVPELCFGAKDQSTKISEVAAKSSFLEKRGVHKQHAKEDFYKKRAEGKTKKMAIREARAIMEEADLSEKVKKRARGIVKIAVAINYGVDSCELGASDDNCASLDLADDRTADETTILTTEDADGSWAVVVDGDKIIVKQTRKIDGTFDMQCWGGSWGTATNYDVSNDTLVKTHTCHNRVFLLGSTQLACDENTCPEGCGANGLCPSDSTEADSTAEVSSSNGTMCNALRDSGNATAFIEGQCCNNC